MKLLYAQLALLALVAGCESTVIGTDDRRSSSSPSASPSSSSSARPIARLTPAGSSSTAPAEEDAGMAPEPEPAPPAGHCEGQATACSATGLVSCDRQAGCFYEDLDCHGTATPCDALTTHTACYWQWGCEWIAE